MATFVYSLTSPKRVWLYIGEKEMTSMFTSVSFSTVRASRSAAYSPARFGATAKAHTNWHTASKPAFYAAFYAVDEATGGSIG